MLILHILCSQVLEVLQGDLNLDIDNLVERSQSYNSSSGLMFMSFLLSFDLKTQPPSNRDILTDIQNSLIVNESNILPVGFNLTNKGFQALAFQSSCK